MRAKASAAAAAGGDTRSANSRRARAAASQPCTRGASARHAAPASADARALSASSAESVRQMQSSAYTAPSLLFAQLAPLLLDQTLQLVEERAVVLAHRVHDAREQGLGPAAASEQVAEHVLGHAALELFARHARRVDVGAPVLLAREKTLLEEPVERRHPGRVGGALAEGAVDFARAHAPAPPDLLHHRLLQLAQRRPDHLARSPEPEESELRHFHFRGSLLPFKDEIAAKD